MPVEKRLLDTPEIQKELISQLESLFSRENLEKNVFFISRMNEKMEIPLQVVYQQKDIYRICPNGRYVLQALKSCSNVTVIQEQLVVIPKIQPRKVRLHVKISDSKSPVTLEALVEHIKQNSNIAILFVKNINATSAFLMVETEELAAQLNDWIAANKLSDEPVEHSVKEENVQKQFKFNVKDELTKYKAKFNEDKRFQDGMKTNFEYFQQPKNIPASGADKIGENIFANPYNYFFDQTPLTQEQYNQFMMMMIQQQMQASQQNFEGEAVGNNLKKNNRARGQRKANNRSKSRGGENAKRSSHQKQAGDAARSRNKSTEDKSASTKKAPRKPKVKIAEDNEQNFPTLGGNSVQPVEEKSSSWATQEVTEKSLAEVTRQTRKNSAEKRVTISTTNEAEAPRDRKVSESRDKIRERQVSESRERQVRPREQSITKGKEEVVYIRKGKDIKITYEKNALLSIFLTIKESITPPASIVESSKDQFIPVINMAAPKEIELTKPTEVIEHHSNPSTPYQAPATMPYRKSSISRSNIKRKESERIVEVDETKAV